MRLAEVQAAACWSRIQAPAGGGGGAAIWPDSGWAEYRQTQSVCGVLPAGLTNAAQLPQPIFTLAAKAAVGEHDENITFAQVEATTARTGRRCAM